MSEQEKLDAALAGKAKVAQDTGTLTRGGRCKCGRIPRLNPETGKLTRHRIGKEHPSFTAMAREKRKEMWCPEVTE
jgi:hypothetical protein